MQFRYRECKQKKKFGQTPKFHYTQKKTAKHLLRSIDTGEHTKQIKENYILKATYQKCTLLYNELVQNYEKDCELRILKSNDIGAFYRFTNKRLGNKFGISCLYDGLGNMFLVMLVKLIC